MNGGLFATSLFSSSGLGQSLGQAPPPGSAGIALVRGYRSTFPSLPSEPELMANAVTHFTTHAVSGGTQMFVFYNSDGREVMRLNLRPGASASLDDLVLARPTAPAPGKDVSLPAYRPDDGLLPSPTPPPYPTAVDWTPWAIAGGVAVVGVVGVYMLMRPRQVRANRRRRRRAR